MLKSSLKPSSLVASFFKSSLLNSKCFSSSSASSQIQSKKSIINPHHKLITPVELRTRQKRLVENVFKDGQTGFSDYLILIPGALLNFQTDTIIPNIHFKQTTDFIYFTGLNRIDSAECVLALIANNGKIKETNLYAPTISEEQSVWQGDGVKSSQNCEHINNICDQIQDISKLYNLLSFTFNDKPIYATPYLMRYERIKNYCASNAKMAYTLSNYIDRLRLIKSEAEMNAMRRACKLGANALKKTMEWSSQEREVNENQLACLFDYESRINGAVKMSYPAVCAGNDRATIIHYAANSENLESGDWVLMDAGCEDLDGYCSDITRSWQIGTQSGLTNKTENNSKLQFALYQAICELQRKLLSSVEVGNTTSNSLFIEMCDGLLVILKEFGVIESSPFNTKHSFNQIYPYCPHHVSHFLGLDVHDSRTVSREVKLEAGMCFTIEPGLYFRSIRNVRDEFKGIGLRIEDDFLINERNEVENLSADCPL